MKFVKVEHPVLGVTSMVPEDSLNGWGSVGWVLSEDQPVDPDEIQPEPVVVEPVPEPVAVEAEPQADVTPVGDSVVETPAETGTESAEG